MNSKMLWIILIAFFFLAGGVGAFFFLRSAGPPPEDLSVEDPVLDIATEPEDLFTLRIYYPLYTRLHMVEKRIPQRIRQTAIAEAVIEEFFKGFGEGKISHMPSDVKLLGLYTGPDEILYIDLSDEFRRDFQGGALSEYLLLKGLYESLISNLRDFQDFKLLVEGKELETLGGHFYLKYSLKNLISYEITEKDAVAA